MTEICKKRDIMVIQGDVLEMYFELNGIDPEIVKNVYFSSQKANLRFPLPYSPEHDAYCLRLVSSCTVHINPVICNYDLTIEFIDGNRMTVLHECCFAILKKRNFVEEEEENGNNEEDGGE